MWEALRMATDEEMERDPTVCVMGTRITGYTGVSSPVGPDVSRKVCSSTAMKMVCARQRAVQDCSTHVKHGSTYAL
jgi:hypothetical protein